MLKILIGIVFILSFKHLILCTSWASFSINFVPVLGNNKPCLSDINMEFIYILPGGSVKWICMTVIIEASR